MSPRARAPRLPAQFFIVVSHYRSIIFTRSLISLIDWISSSPLERLHFYRPWHLIIQSREWIKNTRRSSLEKKIRVFFQPLISTRSKVKTGRFGTSLGISRNRKLALVYQKHGALNTSVFSSCSRGMDARLMNARFLWLLKLTLEKCAEPVIPIASLARGIALQLPPADTSCVTIFCQPRCFDRAAYPVILASTHLAVCTKNCSLDQVVFYEF